MSHETMGLISGGMVVLSIIPYAMRVYERKITPVPTSWALWSLIGLALLLTYRSAGAQANVWPAIFGFTNPTIVTFLAVWRRAHWRRPQTYEWACLAFGVIALGMWVMLQGDKKLAAYALYAAIAADLCAAIPTLVFFSRSPMEDRPFAWVFFAAGYFLGVFAIEEQTLANYALPIYMSVGSAAASLLLIVPRIRQRVPLREWI